MNTGCPSGAQGLMPVRKLAFILGRRGAGHQTPCHMPSVGFVGIGKTGSLFMQTALELFAHEQLLPTRVDALSSVKAREIARDRPRSPKIAEITR